MAGLEKAAVLVFVILASPVLARWRVARRERAEAAKPLFDVVLLEAALAPRLQDHIPTLQALRETFRDHNRVGDAALLVTEIRSLNAILTGGQGETLLRALHRLQKSPNESLARIATETLSLLNPLSV